MKFHGITLITRDVRRLAEFYERVLGARAEFSDDDFASIEVFPISHWDEVRRVHMEKTEGNVEYELKEEVYVVS